MPLDAVSPINYNTNFDNATAQSPLQALQQGVAAGSQLATARNQNLQNAQTIAINQQMQTDLRNLYANPTPDNIAAMSVRYPQLAENFKKSYDMMSETQQKAKLTQALPIYSALQNGDIKTATDLLEQQAVAFENAGRTDDAKQARTMAKVFAADPAHAKLTSGLIIASALGPEKFQQTAATIGDQTRANQVQPAKVQQENAKAGIETANANVAPVAAVANVQKTQSETALNLGKVGELPPENLKIVNDSSDSAAVAKETASRYLDVADKIDAAGPQAFLGGVNEAFKNITGRQDYITEVRQEYNRLRSTDMVKSLPVGGKFTDTDIKLAAKGFPEDTSNPAVMSSFLRGAAKLQQIQAARESTKSEWAAKNGKFGIGPLRQDTVIDNVLVPKGTKLDTYLPLYTARIVGDMNKQNTQSTIAARPYMRFANPPEANPNAPRLAPKTPGELLPNTFENTFNQPGLNNTFIPPVGAK